MIREANLHWRYVDGDVIMPWYTLPALEWLKSVNVSDWRVFEYGAGYSTIWWTLNAHSVESVDHDPRWAEPFGAVYQPIIPYINAPFGMYDCIIVDGQERMACIEKARNHVKPQGFLIVDNFEFFGPEDQEAIKALLSGYILRPYKQPNHTAWTTLVAQKQ